MTVLVVGATGATGRLLVERLLGHGQEVRVIVRSPDKLPADLRIDPALSIVHANLLDLSDAELRQHIQGCKAIASCLGHAISLRGIYGSPRRLVADATRRLCAAVEASGPPVRFVLMSTAGNRGPGESVSFGHRLMLGLIRWLLPPHADNEQAVGQLRDHAPRAVEWVAVRPDTLVDGDDITEYEVHPWPTRSALFDAGKTSRINVARFMADLICDDPMWARWKGKMPVVYNKGFA